MATDRSWLKGRYGITEEDYQLMLEDQHHLCPICRRFLPGYYDSDLCAPVDHDHATGAVRGILCGNCNTGLGMFRDRVAYLQRAIQYLCGDLQRQGLNNLDDE